MQNWIKMAMWCWALLLSAIVQAEQPSEATANAAPMSQTEHVYKKTPRVDLKIYLDFPEDWKPSDSRPAIVFFGGGGWATQSAKQFSTQASYLAGRGMVAARADYRVMRRHKTTPFECVEDAKSAVRWLRQNAGRLGIDPDRIVASGGSAGGHMAACTAVVDGLDAKDEDAAVSSKPNALVLFNPVLDLEPLSRNNRQKSFQNPEDALKISPCHHQKKGVPPALILFGSDDRFGESAFAYRKKSMQLGNRVELYIEEGQKHGFFNRSPSLEKTLHRTDEFLTTLGYTEGPPTLERAEQRSKATPSQDVPNQSLPVSIRPKSPYRFWYQPQFSREQPSLYPYVSYVSAVNGPEDVAFWTGRGVAVSRWAYGPQSPHSQGKWEYYRHECNPHAIQGWTVASVDVDEWMPPGEKDYAACAKGMREAKKQWPNTFIACYVTNPHEPTFQSLVLEGTIDLAIIEGYTNIWNQVNMNWDWVLNRCDSMKQGGLIDKTVVLFGHISDAMTPDHLNGVVALVHDSYPGMPGMGYYGISVKDEAYGKSLILFAERLAELYYGDDVLFIDGFESGRFESGQWHVQGTPQIDSRKDKADKDSPMAGANARKAAMLNGGSSITRHISTKGRRQVQLQYSHRAVSLEGDDSLRIEWYDGQAWHAEQEVRRQGGFARYNKSLAPASADNEQFAIRFTVTGRPEAAAYIDLVRVTGKATAALADRQ